MCTPRLLRSHPFLLERGLQGAATLPLGECTPQGGSGWKKGLSLTLHGVLTGWGAWWPLHTCDVTFIKAVAVLQLTSRSLRAGCAIIKGASEIIVSAVVSSRTDSCSFAIGLRWQN